VIERELLAQGREAEVFLQADGTVLKLLRDPAHAWWVEAESAALRSLGADGYPVPAFVGTATVDGRPGLVTERVDGRNMLDVLDRRPLSVFAAGRAMGELHAAMHGRLAPPELPALHEVLAERIADADALPDELRSRVSSLLGDLPTGDRLCHGDMHIGNILGTPDAPAVIDWGDATRGAPTGDLARTWILVRFGTLPPGAPLVARALAPVGRRIILARYLRTYRAARPVDDALLARWQVVCAAARLWDPVPEDHPAVLGYLRGHIDHATGR
jgi:Ser/Thr protein kinase RdoA (MazF antagonist)